MTDGRHKASVTIDARVDAADRDIKKLTRRINGMEKELRRADKAAATQAETLRKIGRAGAIAATVAVGAAAGLFRLAEASAEAANETAKTAKGLGFASDELQRLEFATGRATKATSQQLHKALGTLTVGLQDAVTKGTGPVAEGLKEIGLEAWQLQGLGIEDQFAMLAAEIQKIPDANRAAAVSMKLFGQRSGQALTPLLREGPAAIRAYGDEAERLGIVLDSKALAASERFIDSLSDTKLTLSAVVRDVSLAAVPAFEDASNGIREWTVENRELIDQDLPIVIGAITDGLGGMVSELAQAVEFFADLSRKAEGFVDTMGPVIEWAQTAAEWSNPTSLVFSGADSLGQIGDATFAGSASGGIGGAIGAAARAQQEARRNLPVGADFGPSLEAASEKVQRQQAVLSGRLRDTEKAAKGARKEVKSLLETMLEADKGHLDAFTEDLADLSFLQSGLVDPFSAENRQIGLDAMAQRAAEEREIEQARRDGLLQDELEHLELRRELGADPMVLLDQEQQARLAHNDFLLEQAGTEAEVLRLQNERRRIYHDAEMGRIAAERQQQMKRMQTFEEIGDGIEQVYQATAAAAIAAAMTQGMSVREAVRSSAQAEAIRSTITAGSAFVQALFWAAVPGGQAQAAAFTAAGVKASAFAVAMGALAGGLSGGGGAQRGLGGASFDASGSPATRPQLALPEPSTLPGSDSPVPGSPPATETPGAPPTSSNQNSDGGGGLNFQGAVFHLYGAGGREDFIEGVTRDQEKLRLKRRT